MEICNISLANLMRPELLAQYHANYKWYKIAYVIVEYEPNYQRKMTTQPVDIATNGALFEQVRAPQIHGRMMPLSPSLLTWNGYMDAHLEADQKDLKNFEIFLSNCEQANVYVFDELKRKYGKTAKFISPYKKNTWLVKPNIMTEPTVGNTTATYDGGYTRVKRAPWIRLSPNLSGSVEQPTINPDLYYNAHVIHDCGGIAFENPWRMGTAGARDYAYVSSNSWWTSTTTYGQLGHYRFHVFVKFKELKPAKLIHVTGTDLVYSFKPANLAEPTNITEEEEDVDPVVVNEP